MNIHVHSYDVNIWKKMRAKNKIVQQTKVNKVGLCRIYSPVIKTNDSPEYM